MCIITPVFGECSSTVRTSGCGSEDEGSIPFIRPRKIFKYPYIQECNFFCFNRLNREISSDNFDNEAYNRCW